jgi:hypothetical protein
MHQEQEETKICKVLKLSNGETIVGNISKETVSYIDIELPLKILIMMHPQSGKMNLSILKWDPIMDYHQPIRIYKNSIVACAEPTKMMMNSYNEVLEQSKQLVLQEEEEQSEDEITELNNMMTELLNRMKGKGNTFH